MTMLIRVRDVAAGLAKATGRQARRARIKVERRRLDSKLRSETFELGRDLYDQLESGELRADAPGVPDRLAEIARLRAEIETLGKKEELATRVRESIADTDQNATVEASAEQAIDDAADQLAGSPAEQGGEG
ncbi:MAG: hypothetical protein IH609_13965 [Dehalococcoidia bacterium]|nr:hypothetical protein [Dehalococcoidia bacterium]